LKDGMLTLAKAMSADEREKYKEEGLYEKLVDLQNDCDDWETDMEGLGEIYELFDGAADDEEGEDEDKNETRGSSESVVEIVAAPVREPTPPQRKRVFSVIELS